MAQPAPLRLYPARVTRTSVTSFDFPPIAEDLPSQKTGEWDAFIAVTAARRTLSEHSAETGADDVTDWLPTKLNRAVSDVTELSAAIIKRLSNTSADINTSAAASSSKPDRRVSIQRPEDNPLGLPGPPLSSLSAGGKRRPLSLSGSAEPLSASSALAAVAAREVDARAWEMTNLYELCSVHHPNVVLVFGGISVQGRFFAVQEALAGGSLAGFLDCARLSPPIDASILATIALETAAGCQFLGESTPFIAAHLTTRTVLLELYGGQLRPKIMLPAVADCWQSRLIWSGDARRGAALRGLWTAPEARCPPPLRRRRRCAAGPA